jgi:muconolactone delta-isomerase
VESLLDLSRKINRALDDVARLNSVLADTPEVGTTHAEVETLLRRHEDLDRDLDGTETRNQALLKAGSALVNKPPNNRALIRKPHEKVSSMLFKLQEALKRFPGLRDQSQQKKVLLLDSLSYQTWKGDVEDLNQWMDLLLPVMDAEPSEDDISSEKAYRRHAKQVRGLLNFFRWKNKMANISIFS